MRRTGIYVETIYQGSAKLCQRIREAWQTDCMDRDVGPSAEYRMRAAQSPDGEVAGRIARALQAADHREHIQVVPSSARIWPRTARRGQPVVGYQQHVRSFERPLAS